MNQAFVAGALAACLLVTLNACSHSSDSASTPDPKVISSMSAAERALRCFLFVNPERDTTQRQDFIEALHGTWDHLPTTSSDDKRTFDFDTDREVGTVTDYYGWGKDIQDIAWGKLCISEPLGSDQGAYAGYRVIEMMAKDNSGAAAIAVKITTESAGPDLFLSDYYYQHWATPNDTLADLSTALGQMKNLWEYSVKEP